VVGVLQLAHTADVAGAQRLPADGRAPHGSARAAHRQRARLLSQKPLLVAAVRAKSLPTSVSQVKVNTVLVGFVSAIKSFGVFVAFGDQLSGLAPPFELQDEGRRRPEQLFEVGQTVRAFVRNVSDNESHGAPLQLSLRPSLCAPAPGAYLGALLDARGAPPAALRSGAVAKASVLARGADGSLKLQLPDGVTGIVEATQVRDDRRPVADDADNNNNDEVVRVGDKVTCVVLDFDPHTRTASASLRSSLLAVPKKKNAPPAAGSDVKGVVEAVSDSHCVLSLPAHPGLLLYATSHDYNYRQALTLEPGDRVDGVVASVDSRTVAAAAAAGGAHRCSAASPDRALGHRHQAGHADRRRHH
jgi:ribosomal protein S1